MNYTILNQYDIKFVNVNGRKKVSFKGNELIERYIYTFKDVTTLNELIADVNLAINGQIEDTENYLYESNPPVADVARDDGGAYIFADLMANGVMIYENEIINDSITIPLEDFKEILLSWKEFLQS
ncbi:MAG: hypothetical protein RBR78_00040 [Flavobacteriaceae bacterium]|jgi:hypothetical protein|nr:hypothetical protein [Flavobacteriaceae bacterium]